MNLALSFFKTFNRKRTLFKVKDIFEISHLTRFKNKATELI
jgi:hypothetical protein